MKNSLPILAALALLAGVAPAFGAPKAKPKAPAKVVRKAPAKAVAKVVADPLAIPEFAPIPNEFVFAGTQKDVYKLLSGYTKGFSLESMPTPTPEEIAASENSEALQAIANVKNLLAPIHVISVRSVSYYALGEAAQDEAYEKLGANVTKSSAGSVTNMPGVVSEMERQNRGYERSKQLLGNAETFYKNLLTKQGGKVQTQLGGETSITVYAFAQPQTFAVVTRGPSRVIVARADGKPDVGAISGIFQRVVGGG